MAEGLAMWEEFDFGFGLESIRARRNPNRESWAEWEPSCPVGSDQGWNACRAKPYVRVIATGDVLCLTHAVEYLSAKIADPSVSSDWWHLWVVTSPRESERVGHHG